MTLCGELVWDYNHNQLPTKLRLYRLHRSDDDQCPICNCHTPETDDHLMLLCPARQDIQSWLRIQLTKLHCTKPIRDAIHGDIGACPTKKPYKSANRKRASISLANPPSYPDNMSTFKNHTDCSHGSPPLFSTLIPA